MSLDRVLRALDPVKRLRLRSLMPAATIRFSDHEANGRQPLDRPRSCKDRADDVEHAGRFAAKAGAVAEDGGGDNAARFRTRRIHCRARG